MADVDCASRHGRTRQAPRRATSRVPARGRAAPTLLPGIAMNSMAPLGAPAWRASAAAPTLAGIPSKPPPSSTQRWRGPGASPGNRRARGRRPWPREANATAIAHGPATAAPRPTPHRAIAEGPLLADPQKLPRASPRSLSSHIGPLPKMRMAQEESGSDLPRAPHALQSGSFAARSGPFWATAPSSRGSRRVSSSEIRSSTRAASASFTRPSICATGRKL